MIFSTVALAARLVLAAVFIASGIGKLRSPGSVGHAVQALGLPYSLGRGVLARAFPWCEILLGAALLAAPGRLAAIPAAAALVLCTAFTVLVVRAVRSGTAAACNCFGASDTPMSWWTAARNVLLVAVSAVLLASAFAVRTPWAELVAAGVVPAVLGVLLIGALGFSLAASEFAGSPAAAGQVGAVPASSSPGPAVDEDGEYVRRPNPAVVLERLTGEREMVPSTNLFLEGPSVVVYVSPGCGSCHRVLEREPEIRAILGNLRMAYIMPEYTSEIQEPWDRSELEIYRDKDGLFTQLLGMQFSPSMVLLGADGLTAAGPEYGVDAIIETVEEIAAVLAEAEQTNPHSNDLPEEKTL
jgi:uncharacterized membrane protein YphA (DoxX/SURF4 family)